jgi:hypothetical protein
MPKPTPTPTPSASRSLTEGQRAYEAKRAAKAGMSLDKWLAEKDRQAAEAARAEAKAARAAAKTPAKPPGFFSRLLERAHKPL